MKECLYKPKIKTFSIKLSSITQENILDEIPQPLFKVLMSPYLFDITKKIK